jgi:copper homeostasis protein
MLFPVEVCVEATTPAAIREAVAAAFAGGAARVELCRAMAEQGLTPTHRQVVAARSACPDRPGLLVMIRPRAGNFSYTPAEVQRMEAQIARAADARAAGVVFGLLRPDDQRVDVEATRRLVAVARQHGLATTFHRAFDATPDPLEALRTLLDLGLDRVLTSGTAWGQPGTALDGVARLAALIHQAGHQIEVVVGGGVRAGHLPALIARLPVAEGRLSFHAYSGAQEQGRTTPAAVRQLVAAARIG